MTTTNMTTPAPYEIGDRLNYRNRDKVTREGRAVGSELVTDPRKRIGWHFIIDLGGSEYDVVHSDCIGGRIV